MYSAKTFPQNYSYTTWKCFHSNPKVWNHENDHFLNSTLFRWCDIENEHFSKSHFFRWCAMMKNVLSEKCSFSMVQQKKGKWKAEERKVQEVFSSKTQKNHVLPHGSNFLLFLVFQRKIFPESNLPNSFSSFQEKWKSAYISAGSRSRVRPSHKNTMEIMKRCKKLMKPT